MFYIIHDKGKHVIQVYQFQFCHSIGRAVPVNGARLQSSWPIIGLRPVSFIYSAFCIGAAVWPITSMNSSSVIVRGSFFLHGLWDEIGSSRQNLSYGADLGGDVLYAV